METINGRITIRDILLKHDNWQRFVEAHGDHIRPAVYENVRRMLACRTPQLGFHLYACPACGHQRIVPHTCKSRLCSSCGKPATDRWAQKVLNDTLDVEYHHLVVSVPWQLRALTLANRRLMLNILFRSAADAIIPWCQTYHDFTPGMIAWPRRGGCCVSRIRSRPRRPRGGSVMRPARAWTRSSARAAARPWSLRDTTSVRLPGCACGLAWSRVSGSTIAKGTATPDRRARP